MVAATVAGGTIAEQQFVRVDVDGNGGRGLLIMGHPAAEDQVRCCHALIPSVEGAQPQGATRSMCSVSAAFTASSAADVRPPSVVLTPAWCALLM